MKEFEKTKPKSADVPVVEEVVNEEVPILKKTMTGASPSSKPGATASGVVGAFGAATDTQTKMKADGRHDGAAAATKKEDKLGMNKAGSSASIMNYIEDSEEGKDLQNNDDDPVPTRATARASATSGIPGAHREGDGNQGGGGGGGSDDGQRSHISSSRDGGGEDDDDEDEGASANLAVAHMVNHDEEIGRGLQEARAAAPKGPSEVARVGGFVISFHLALCIVVVFVAMAATIVALVVLRDDDTTNSDNNKKTLISTTTQSPFTSAPTSYESYLLNLLPDYTQSVVLDQPESPQAKAFQWLLEDQSVDAPLLVEDERRIVQRYSLATLYFSTDGDRWQNNQGWLNHSVHECDWYQNKEFALKSIYSAPHILPGFMNEFWPPPQPQPSICNYEGIYQHLWLDNNKMVSTPDGAPLPNELYLLTSLTTLSLGLMQLHGPISSHIGQMTNLEGFLTTFGPGKGGPLPSQMGLLTRLKGLSLTNTGSTGTFPTQFGRLSNLQTVLLGRNQFSGTVPDPTNWPKLKWLNIDGSSLTGTIPTQFGSIETLEWLALGRNILTGTIPSQLGQAPNMSLLSLLLNEFLDGSLPTQLGLLTKMTMITFRGCDLTGTIPSELGMMTDLFHTCDLKGNPRLGGTIPIQLGLFSNLYALDFTNNNHTGRVPSQFGQLTSLGRLELANNTFLTGTIPETLASITQKLFTLTLQDTGLSGTIPKPLCSINATCLPNTLRVPCGETKLVFDCGLLCGCDCPCDSATTAEYVQLQGNQTGDKL